MICFDSCFFQLEVLCTDPRCALIHVFFNSKYYAQIHAVHIQPIYTVCSIVHSHTLYSILKESETPGMYVHCTVHFSAPFLNTSTYTYVNDTPDVSWPDVPRTRRFVDRTFRGRTLCTRTFRGRTFRGRTFCGCIM